MGRRDRKRGKRDGKPARRGRRDGGGKRSGALAAGPVFRILGRAGRPLLSPGALLRELSLPRERLNELRQLLGDLAESGSLEAVRGRYRLRRRDGLIEGRYEAPETGGRGGARVEADDGVAWRVAAGSEARSGDRVLVQPIGDPKRHRAELLEVVSRPRDLWVGLFERRGRRGRLIPYRDDADWVVEVTDAGGARDGDVVEVLASRVGERPKRARGSRARSAPAESVRLRGRVTRVFGVPGDPDADFHAIVWRRRLPLDFPPEVGAEAAARASEPPGGEAGARVDLRDRCFFTIDPATARDHDDALCVEAEPGGGFRLWVAIADVARFVRPGSAMDREALRRGNSVYFPHRAIPMLPEALSSDLCSLRPDVDRLAMVVELAVNGQGAVEQRRFYRATIRSRARLVYADVARALAGETAAGVAPELMDPLRSLVQVTDALRRRRLGEGSLDLEIPEARVVLGDDGRIRDVVASERTAAHRAVEDAMLAANRAVAELLVEADHPALHRNHEPPLPRDAETLWELFEIYGLGSRASGRGAGSGEHEAPSPRQIAAALAQVAGRPEARLVNERVLRSMTQARYGVESRGHFALAFPRYTHFTSPIRRYADLVVHRALADVIAAADAAGSGRRRAGDGASPGRFDLERLQRVAARVSWRERVAVEAEREAVDLQKCALLQGREGEEFDAAVTGASPFGLWLTLDAHFVQGLVHVSTLREYVEFDERRHAFRAVRSGERFELGDRFRVRLENVDLVQTRIDLRILDRLPREAQSADSSRSRSPSSL